MTFDELGLCDPILQAISASGYKTPSPIQEKAIPPIMDGCDVMAAAQTGTGKTAGFTLPLLHRLQAGEKARANQARALILTPTRELAAQVGESVRTYGQSLRLTSAVVYGGVKINPQMMRMRRGADILVATPGRLIDLYQQNAVRFKQLEVLILDEADRMLDMGFIHDIRKIIGFLPEQRQTLMFSATFSDDIRKLAKTLTVNPVEISVTPPNSTAKSVKQCIHPVDKKRKPDALLKLIRDGQWRQVLVFTKTKHGANKLTRFLSENGLKSTAIHGNKSQGARTRALLDFKTEQVSVLVATDIAARGLDIDQLPHVVNFDLPNVAEDYVHRIGRTGRAGAAGEAVSLVCADEYDLLVGIERLIKKSLERIELEGLEPTHELPLSKPLNNSKTPNSRTPKPRPKTKPNRGGNKPSGGGNKPSGPGKPNAKKPAKRPAKPQASGNKKSPNANQAGLAPPKKKLRGKGAPRSRPPIG